MTLGLTPEEVLDILRATGALLEGHFQLTSGRHSDRFFLMPHTLQHPLQTERLCRALAARFQEDEVETVVGPATGGIILAYEVARQLERLTGRPVRAIFTEKTEDGGMALKRQWRLRSGERVLVVEDAITTGGSVVKAIAALQAYQPALVGVGCIVDRSRGAVDFGVPLRPLIRVDVESWPPDRCPLCLAGVPVVKPKA
ncbi:orotate phosphoribosyltransferase [Symbiobacterium thermophilum]|uniref:orotate phosphoribosyltransferase n=1 Tax=Symbiobacterium thermophilum TaxID=2734 RepID=UPI000309C436|nr:orotate phosphoribosyltransferase [Symbiobacterium thermophilum]